MSVIDLREANAQLTNYPNEFVLCRDCGHQWSIDSYEIDKITDCLVRKLTCIRCGNERHESFKPSGELNKRRYRPKPNYGLHSNGVRFNKSFWRGLQYQAAAKLAQQNLNV